ncbi:hypothetical protein KS4_17210 [Poriferisphaera corsica]|uniref:Uncharacterized protein n=1 Tax=Poriferisphaera corsica TaxID=2528020 RepID=A0A517YTV6_9BACT|nr:hypothetical protein [Poriferisphaera corsica]QDU33665.1 hypothetical protein KS4_17210 [Poriferisphaera corsica]
MLRPFRHTSVNILAALLIITLFLPACTAPYSSKKQNSLSQSEIDKLKEISSFVEQLKAQPQLAEQPMPTQPAPPLTTNIKPSQPNPSPQQANQAPIVEEPTTPPVAISVDLKNPLAGLEQQEILSELIRRSREENSPALQKAMLAASLSLLDQNQEMDWSITTKLSPNQKRMVERYHAMLLALYSQAADSKYKLDRAKIDLQLNSLFGNQPLNITTAKLIYSVLSYGVYKPFESTTFLAGKDNRLALYCELDNYKINQTPNDQYEANLKQEISLYDSNGYQVWKHEAKRIKDVCRNPRRDFYTAMKFTLPARIGVGKFRLKIRITDENNDAVAETSIPISFVANYKVNSVLESKK